MNVCDSQVRAWLRSWVCLPTSSSSLLSEMVPLERPCSSPLSNKEQKALSLVIGSVCIIWWLVDNEKWKIMSFCTSTLIDDKVNRVTERWWRTFWEQNDHSNFLNTNIPIMKLTKELRHQLHICEETQNTVCSYFEAQYNPYVVNLSPMKQIDVFLLEK